jgi:sulfide:quinone oxidoreductase
MEFGGERVGRIDVNFLAGPTPTGNYVEASQLLVGEKQDFGAIRQRRWFGLPVEK